MIELVTALGRWWAGFLTAHPFGTGLWLLGLGLVLLVTNAARKRYPDFATRPEWARWLIFIVDPITGNLWNLFLKRWPGKEPE